MMKRLKLTAALCVAVCVGLSAQQAHAYHNIRDAYISVIERLETATLNYIDTVSDIAVDAIEANPGAAENLYNVYSNALTRWCNSQISAINRVAGVAVHVLNSLGAEELAEDVEDAQASAVAEIQAACEEAIEEMCMAAFGEPDITVEVSVNGAAAVDLADTSSIVIGPFETGTTQTFEVTVRNDGGCPLVITDLELPESFTVVGSEPSLPISLAADEEATLTLELTSMVETTIEEDFTIISNDPDAEGEYTGTISVQFMDAEADIEVMVDGTVVESGDTISATLPAGSGNAEFTVVVSNVGGEDLTLESIVDPLGVVTGYTAATLDGTTTEEFTVTINDTILAGNGFAAISIPSDDPDEDPFVLVFDVEFTVGEPEITVDLAAEEVSGQQGATTDLQAGTSLNGPFINRVAGDPLTLELTVTNDGEADLMLTAAPTISGYMETSGNATLSIPAGGSTTFVFESMLAEPDVSEQFVTILSNDADESIFDSSILMADF